MKERQARNNDHLSQRAVQTVVPVNGDGRVDVLIAQTIAGWSRRHLHELFDKGAVRINGRRARKGDRVQIGDVVLVDQPVSPDALDATPDLPVRVLHVDNDVIVVNKPAGMPSVARRLGDTGTVANFLVGRFPELREASENPLEAGLVHRLDSATSGVLLVARTRAMYERLRLTFSQSAIKEYLAVVRGPGPRTDRITTPIAHMPRRPRRMRVCEDPGMARNLAARSADTAYRALRVDTAGALLAIRIRTGVRHQIRVHLAARGRPIVGDEIYSRDTTGDGTRLLLHAYRVQISYPGRAHPLDCIAELPEDFAALLNARGWRAPQPSDWDDL